MIYTMFNLIKVQRTNNSTKSKVYRSKPLIYINIRSFRLVKGKPAILSY